MVLRALLGVGSVFCIRVRAQALAALLHTCAVLQVVCKESAAAT
jgi:hypothetical protein